jgi:DNA-binding winged helix-turn-helix (wHTH) protein
MSTNYNRKSLSSEEVRLLLFLIEKPEELYKKEAF